MSTQLTPVNVQMSLSRGGVEIKTLQDAVDAAKMVHDAGWGPKNMNATQMAVAIMHGLEAGLQPMFSLQNIAVINGRPSLFGDAVMGLIHQSGLLEDINETEFLDPRFGDPDGRGWKVSMKRKGVASAMTRTYTVKDAKRSNLWGKAGPWTTNPGRMLLIRARCFVARDLFADVLHGMRIAEEQLDIPPEPERPADFQVVGAPRLEDLFVRPQQKPEPTPGDVQVETIPLATPPARKHSRSRMKAAAEPVPPPAPVSDPPSTDIPPVTEDLEPEEGLGEIPFDQASPAEPVSQPEALPLPVEPAKPAPTKKEFVGKALDMFRAKIMFDSDAANEETRMREDIAELVVEVNKCYPKQQVEMPRLLEQMPLERLRGIRDSLRRRLQG